MNTHYLPEGPHYSGGGGGGGDSMAALSQVSGGNHTYPGSSHDRLNERDASLSYGYGYSPSGTPTHSYSTAERSHSEHPSLGRGGSSAQPPVRKGGKPVPHKVQMLDDSVIALHVPNGCLGEELFKACCRHLNLLEMDYFGLEYFNKSDKVMWLDLEKPITRQVGAPKKTLFHFTVKFYLADPGQLHDEFTKYLYALQIKKDLANGKLPCSENTAALMASYMLQAEVGDYSAPEHDDGRYITAFRFVPNQTRAMESKIQEYHKNHVGQTPADADFNLLDVARRLEMYGVQLHSARDYEGVQLHLAVSHQGVLVFHNNSRINTFSWAKIRKVSFKRKRFLVKLHPEGFGYPRSTVEFMMTSRNECKRFWKSCVEHHTFFRLTQPRHGRRPRRRLMSRGSTFRYSGRTQKQVVEDARVTYIQRPGFGPSLSRVSTRSLGAPRTTTPLTVNLTESMVPDHHSAPDLTYGDGYPNGQAEPAVGSPESVSPTTPSSTPVTPVHDNSRIAIHKGQSNSSITYEYTVNEDSLHMQSPDQNGQGPGMGLGALSTESEQTTDIPSSEETPMPKKPELPQLPQMVEEEQQQQQPQPQPPVINGDHHNNHHHQAGAGLEGLSTNYSTDASDISIPSGSLHMDLEFESRRLVLLDLPAEIERPTAMTAESGSFPEGGTALPSLVGKRLRSESTSSSCSSSDNSSSGSSSGSHSLEDGEGLEYEDEIQAEPGFDLEILEGLGGPALSEFEDDSVGKRVLVLPDVAAAATARFGILGRMPAGGGDDWEGQASPSKSVEVEMGSAGSETSGDLLGSLQAAASEGSGSSEEEEPAFVRAERASTEIRLSSAIDAVLKIAAELASPRDEAPSPSFESRSLDSFLNEEEEGSEEGGAGRPPAHAEGDLSPREYSSSSFTKERRLVFDATSSDEETDSSSGSSLGATLGQTNKNLTDLEENLDQTSANLRLLEESLAETRKSLRAMESDTLSSADTSPESPAFPSIDSGDRRDEIELASDLSPQVELPACSTPDAALSEDILNANATDPTIARAGSRGRPQDGPLDEADLAQALAQSSLNSRALKSLRDSPPPPTPPPTPKVSVVIPPKHLPKVPPIDLHRFDDVLPPPPPPPPPGSAERRVRNIAHMLPSLPPPPPLPMSPPPDSPPLRLGDSQVCPSPLSPPHATIMKPVFSYSFQHSQSPVPKSVPPPRPPKPKPIRVEHRSFEEVEMSPVPPTPPPRMESKGASSFPPAKFEFASRSVTTTTRTSSHEVRVDVEKTHPPPPPMPPSAAVAKKEAGVQMSGFSKIQRSEFTELRTARETGGPSDDPSPDLSARFVGSPGHAIDAAPDVSAIRRPPPPIVAPRPHTKQALVAATAKASDAVVITPHSSEMRLARPGTFVTELKMIVRPGSIGAAGKQREALKREKSSKPEPAGPADANSNGGRPFRKTEAELRAEEEWAAKRASMGSADSSDSARQEFEERSLEDLLNSPDIIGYPTPEDEDADSLALTGEASLLLRGPGELRFSETSSTSSGSTDDSCVYHYEVAGAQMSKMRGAAPLAAADGDRHSSDDDSDDSSGGSSSSGSSCSSENGSLNRHANGNGGIVFTDSLAEGSGLFPDLQDIGSPLSLISGETVASSEDFD